VAPLLSFVPPERRKTLVARRVDNAEGMVYRFDICLQGLRGMVFFDI
jgi:protocatechuate 3,4-dioxygenase alpha subunit